MPKAVGHLSLELRGKVSGLELMTGNVSVVESRLWVSPRCGVCLGPRPEAKPLLSSTNTPLSSRTA